MPITEEEACRCLEDAKRLKRRLPSRQKAKETANLLKLLAHPTRLSILNILAEKDVCVCVLAELLGKRQPNISQHLAKLKDNGMIEDYPVGKLTFYRIKDKKIRKLMRNL
ncbi:MAG: metalloregulator ArsR/SmtB family transcription factor [Candidatus Altiarchaeota archaeon]